MGEFFLEHLQGERKGDVDRFAEDLVRVGRSDDCELCFDELGVSWAHAELRARDGELWCIDAGSTNGTYINDEQAHNARLKGGDVIQFGRRGPVLRLHLAPPPTAEGSSASRPARRGKRRRVPSELAVAALDPAVLGEEGPSPAERHSDLPPAGLVLERRSGAGALIAVALAGAAAASAVLLPLLWGAGEADPALASARDAALRELDGLKRSQATALERARAEGREAGRKEREPELEELAEGLRARHQRELERERGRARDHERRATALEREAEDLRAKYEGARRALLAGLPGGPRGWHTIERELRESVLFIACVLKGRRRDGQVVDLVSYGAGFFLSGQGHIATTKEVVQPWKFRGLAQRLAREGISVVEGSQQLHAWRGGARYFLRSEGRALLDPSTGWSTARGTLELVRTAPDTWEDLALPDGPRMTRVHVQGGETDLAILRAQATRVAPLSPGRSSDLGVGEVVVFGFPAAVPACATERVDVAPATVRAQRAQGRIALSGALQPCSAGGPLVDDHGRVMGVCTGAAPGGQAACVRIELALELLHGGVW